jgi:hypothetical protein
MGFSHFRSLKAADTIEAMLPGNEMWVVFAYLELRSAEVGGVVMGYGFPFLCNPLVTSV